MSFAQALRARIEGDDGVVLRLSSQLRMQASAPGTEGRSFGLGRRIEARSRMILAAARALGRRTNEEEEE